MRYRHVFCLITLLLLCGIDTSFAQRVVSDNTPLYSVSTQGRYYTDGKINFSWNLGDPIAYSDSNFFESYFVFQGFEQPDRFDEEAIGSIISNNYKIIYYPNPISNSDPNRGSGHLFIKIIGEDGSTLDRETFTIAGIDLLGRRMDLPSIDGVVFTPGNFPDNTVDIDVSALQANEVYYFTIRAIKSDFAKTIKVVKID